MFARAIVPARAYQPSDFRAALQTYLPECTLGGVGSHVAAMAAGPQSPDDVPSESLLYNLAKTIMVLEP